MEEDRERIVVVGYGFEAKKVKSFLKSSLLSECRDHGIHFLALNPDISLDQQYQQTPFDCLLHKLHGVDWENNLVDFKSKHPLIPIIDCPSAIRRLNHRVSMLDAVSCLPKLSYSFGVPKQWLLTNPPHLILPEEDIAFPVVAKPLEADGHELFLVFNQHGLEKVDPPAVLQEFVNHGGVVFKVYVAGEYVRCVKRKSLPDLNLASMQQVVDIMPFSRISNMAAASAADKDDELEMPPSEMVTHLAAGLRSELNLNLFNFDMIQDKRVNNKNEYLIIDINYFPGYAKLPGYETILTNFFLDLVSHQSQLHPHA